MKRLVISTIYIFAVRSGFGAGTLKQFFEMINIGSHVAISETTILKIIREIELILGVDETWFDKMLLVCQELQSGFIIMEESTETRSAITWHKRLTKNISYYIDKAKILYFVSDRAKALINLAEVCNNVKSVADFFHFKHGINKLLCLVLASKLRFSKQNLDNSIASNNTEQIEIYEQEYAHYQFFSDFYSETMNNFSLILHPYYDGNKSNNSIKVKDDIKDEISKIKDIISQCNIKDKYNLLIKSNNQVNRLVCVIDQWYDIIDVHIENLSLSIEGKNWFINYLLPKTYWQSAIKKTSYSLIKNRLKEQLLFCINSINCSGVICSVSAFIVSFLFMFCAVAIFIVKYAIKSIKIIFVVFMIVCDFMWLIFFVKIGSFLLFLVFAVNHIGNCY